MVLIALCTLILCSCRGPVRRSCDFSNAPAQPYPTLPPEAYSGPMLAEPPAPVGFPGMENGVPLPYMPGGPWAPPHFRQPWPQDEYLRDGGDRGLSAKVGNEWRVEGMDPEDTIAHFETVDGRTLVEPSNRVYLYAPRFGAVRQITNLIARDLYVKAAGFQSPVKLSGPSETRMVATSKQHIQTDRQIGRKLAGVYRTRQGDGAMSTASKARGFIQDMLLPYENMRAIREGQLEMAEMPQLAKGVAAALAWSGDQVPQIIIDEQAAMADTADQASQSVFTIKKPPANPRLRVIKVASTPFAEPGDEVAFTIRFDNVGNQVIGNVTIIDSLTTRLEYIPDSAQCSVDAQFSTQPNNDESLVIRCEITNPLEPEQGGIIRFRCVVR